MVKIYLAPAQANVLPFLIQHDVELDAIMFNKDEAPCTSHRQRQFRSFLQGADKALVKPGLTRQLLWREYLEQFPQWYGFSQFCHQMQRLMNKKDVTMHLEYTAGEHLMMDFAGNNSISILSL